MNSLPLAVHIFDGVLSLPWILGGFLFAGLLGLVSFLVDRWSSQREHGGFRESEIAQIALLTAAFYVASSIHVRVGPTTVHLLFNGLLGVLLRWRVVWAIPVGLFLQVVFFGHGGFTTLGVNSCVLIFPALLAWLIFVGMRTLPCRHSRSFRFVLTTVCSATWLLALLYGAGLLLSNNLLDLDEIDPTWANSLVLHPACLLSILLAGGLVAFLEPKLANSEDFSLGLFVGTLTVLLTTFLNFLVLVFGTSENWRSIALLTFVAHVPIAVLEGLILGFTVGYLAKVKPEMLGIRHKPLPSAAMMVADEKQDIDEPMPNVTDKTEEAMEMPIKRDTTTQFTA